MLSGEAYAGRLWGEADGAFPPPHKQHTSASSFTPQPTAHDTSCGGWASSPATTPWQLWHQAVWISSGPTHSTSLALHGVHLWLERNAVGSWQFCPLVGLIWMTLITVRKTLQHSHAIHWAQTLRSAQVLITVVIWCLFLMQNIKQGAF